MYEKKMASLSRSQAVPVQMRASLMCILLAMATCKVACDSSDDLGHFYSTCAPQALSSQSTSPQAPASVSSNVQSVNKTLSQLRQLASQGSFYGNVTASSSYEHLNGAYLCRQDLTQQECAQCVNEAIQVSQKDCMNVDEASIILNGCIIRYQQIPFFNLDTSSLVWGCNNGTRETSINSKQNMVKLVRTIIDKAPASEQFFSAGIIGDGKNSKVYGMAQCWPYVDLDQCRFCLSDLGDSALSSSSQQQCCNNSDTLFGSRLYHPSCFLRIENFPFFKTKDSMIISVSSIDSPSSFKKFMATAVGVFALASLLLSLPYIYLYCKFGPKDFKENSTNEKGV